MCSTTKKHCFAMDTPVRWWLLSLVLLCYSITLTLALDSNDIQSYLRNLEVSSEAELGSSWGIEDTSAVAGKVFKYSLPQDLFHTGASSLKVTEKGQPQLPHWLEYDETQNLLKGVPGVADVGREVFIEVQPISQLDNTTLKDIFSIKVIEDSVHADTMAVPVKTVSSDKNDRELKPIKCPVGSSVTMATIVLDTDVGILRPRERVSMMEGMCHHLGMPTELVRLLPVGNKPFFESLALVAGPGDVKEPQYSGALLQWEVGCGNVFANHMPILQQLENTAHDGTMGKSVGYGIVGWHVTNNKPQTTKRIKRSILHTPVSTPDIVPPLPTRYTRPASEETNDPDVPATRTVPSLATPDIPEIKPTQTERHHHHTRGPKTHGRHQDHSTSMYKPHTQNHGKSHKPVVHTPSNHPIMPTKAVTDMPSSRGVPDVIHPSEESSPGVSRSVDIIEPSMVHTPMLPSSATEMLPTRGYTMPSVESTDHIEPTSSRDSFTPPTKQPPVMQTSPKPTSAVHTPTPTPTEEEEEVHKPRVINNGLVRMNVVVGDILDYQIPADNFDDYDDGNTRNLALAITTIDNLDLPPDSWLQLDEAHQRLIGLPLEEHIGRHVYLLAAVDSDNHIIHDAFEIFVRMRTGDQQINHELSMKMALNYQKFLLDVKQRIDVAEKLTQAYGDKDMSNIAITKITPGSVSYTWTNKTLNGDTCPESQLLELTGRLITPDGKVNPEFEDAMNPIRVKTAKAEFSGPCAHMNAVHTRKNDDEVIMYPDPDPKKTSEEDVLVTTVAPAVVIAAMLLLGALIVCILYRKRRKGKLSDEDQHTFIQKGVPIILPDELEDKPDPPTKPLIMEDEKPPQPPPDYPHSPSPSTPRSDHKEPLIDTEDEADHHSPLYRPPPPPMSGSLGHRNNRPRTPLSQRSPPQYMSPISP